MAVTSVLALPHAVLGSRYGNGIAHEDRDDSGDPSQDCVWMCGTTCYWLIDVQAAMRRGHKLQASGQGNDPGQFGPFTSYHSTSLHYTTTIMSSFSNLPSPLQYNQPVGIRKSYG